MEVCARSRAFPEGTLLWTHTHTHTHTQNTYSLRHKTHSLSIPWLFFFKKTERVRNVFYMLKSQGTWPCCSTLFFLARETYAYVCVCVRVYGLGFRVVYIYIYILYIHIHTYISHTHTHTHTHVYILYICIHIYIYIYMYIYIYIYIYMYIYCVHVHVYIYGYIYRWTWIHELEMAAQRWWSAQKTASLPEWQCSLRASILQSTLSREQCYNGREQFYNTSWTKCIATH
jgi:hypothetical protein